jgi:hypothetical protein
MIRQKIKKSISKLDILGSEQTFTINYKQKYQSFAGGLISSLLYLSCLLTFYYFGKELYLKSNPSVLLTIDHETNPEEFLLTPQNFSIFLGLQDPETWMYYIDESIYSMEAFIEKYKTVKNVDGTSDYPFTLSPLQIERCNLEKHFPFSKDSFKDQPLEDLLCINYDPIMKLEGVYGSEEFLSLTVRLRQCRNTTSSSVICKPQEEINKKLDGGYFVIDFTTSFFQPKNYSYPAHSLVNDFFTSISTQYVKGSYYVFSNVDYITDSGWFMEELKKERYLLYDSFFEMYDFREDKEWLLIAAMRMGHLKQNIVRKYLKIQDVLAQLGGIIKGFLIIFGFCYDLFSKVMFQVDVFNHYQLISPANREKLSHAKIHNNETHLPSYFNTINNIMLSQPKSNPNPKNELNIHKALSKKISSKKLSTNDKYKVLNYVRFWNAFKVSIFKKRKSELSKAYRTFIKELELKFEIASYIYIFEEIINLKAEINKKQNRENHEEKQNKFLLLGQDLLSTHKKLKENKNP